MSLFRLYEVPKYQPLPGAVWFHVLYGHVPRHQMDFIYRPAVPFEKLLPVHYCEVQSLIQHIGPAPGSSMTFTIGNLSRNDPRHRAGHGGLVVAAKTLVARAKDSAGRAMPVFAHGVFLVDQPVDHELILTATQVLASQLCQVGQQWYKHYAESKKATVELLDQYLRNFSGLPLPRKTELKPVIKPPIYKLQSRIPRYNRLVIHRPPGTPFEGIASAAARIAAVLYHSDVRWISIGDSRQGLYESVHKVDPGEIIIRFVTEPPQQTHDGQMCALQIKELPLDPGEIAGLLGLVEEKYHEPTL